MITDDINTRKVFHVVRRAEGGMQKHVALLLANLHGDFSSVLAASQEFYDSLPEESVDGVDFVPVDISDKLGPRTLLQALQLAGEIRRTGARIVHSHGYKAAVPGVIAARLAGARSIITGHNLFPEKASLLARTSIRIASMLSDRVIAVAPALARSLIAAGVTERKIEVIPNGIDLSVYDTGRCRETREALGIPDCAPVVFCAARLTEVKGVEYLIRSAALISEKKPDALVLIAGDGPDRESLEALARQMAPDTVRFLGRRDDIPDLLAAADIVAMPSLAEGHPLTLVESMAARKPVVASRVGGLADAVIEEETGLLVRPADPEALALAILRLIDSPDLAHKLGLAARHYAEQEFTIERMIDHTKEVYTCVAS
jgi:glycosyltransferase involved in cell wall biosynthesis